MTDDNIETRGLKYLAQNYVVGDKAYWQARAEKAEKERDDLTGRLKTSIGDAKMLEARVKELEQWEMLWAEQMDRIEDVEDKLHRIDQWCEAYPLDIFPEPDLKKARQLLEAGGMTLDAVSASNMRHVLNGIRKIIIGEKL